MSEVSLSPDLVEDILAKGSISAEDVLALRQGVFKDGVVDHAEAETVFELDGRCREKDPTWTQFYVDALTDYFVWQVEPRGYISEEQGRFLIENIAADGQVDGTSELELLINVVHWAAACPEDLALFVLEAVRQSVLTPQSASYGHNRPPTVIAPADVAIIHRAIYAPGSPGGFTVTRQEAELIYELYDACAAAENTPSWDDLFVKAIANHLMFPRGAPIVPDAEEVKRRERWQQERRGVGSLLAETGKAFARADVPLREAFAAADLFGTAEARKEREREEARVREALSREAIDAQEARWLVAHMNRDGVVREAERKLLAFIKQNSPQIDPALDELLEKAGL